VEQEAEEGGEDGRLSFDIAPEQLHQRIAVAFGPMIATSLQSPKWDKRSQALKEVCSVIKGLDLQGMAKPGSTGVLGKELQKPDRARCWRISCQLLHRCLGDKVMPVRLASLELYTDAFVNIPSFVAEEEVDLALNVLFECIIERLGDSSLRLHESARRCVILTAEHQDLLGLGAVLSRLRTRLESCQGRGGERTKVYFGILDAVHVLLQHFPGRRSSDGLGDDDDEACVAHSSADSWTQHDIAPFVAAGMADDSLGPRVRNSAVQLAVAVYQTFGMDSVKPLLAGLRPAKQALLKQKFQESEEDGGLGDGDDDGEDGGDDDGQELRNVDLSGLVVQGCGVKRPTWFQQQMQMQVIPELPGTIGEEEVMMDGILEEAGAVFSGAGIVQEEEERARSPPFQRARGQQQAHEPSIAEESAEDEFEDILEGARGSRTGAGSPRLRDELVHLEDSQRVLEQELLNLGIDLEDIEEQRTILSSLQAEQFEAAAVSGHHNIDSPSDPSVEALLSGLVQNCHGGDVSIEVF
jgi:hypothetical protein